LEDVESSLFADDSAIYKSGRNMAHLQKVVQRNLDRIQSWCDMWGFLISTEKSVAVPFTNSKETVNFTVNGRPIHCVKETKFLGMIFDSRLTWSSHISYVVAECKKRESNASSSWQTLGCQSEKPTKALIRSVIDYGAIAYDNATESQLARLDSVQCQALRISTGAMRGTSLAIMQAHWGEMPLQLIRLKSQAEYCAKVTNTVGHVSSRIFGNHWTQHYGRFSERNQPITVKFSGIQDTLNKMKVAGPQLGNVPSWLIDPPRTDDTLASGISKHEEPEALLALSKCLIEDYGDCTHVYTDSSKTADGKVGIGCYIEA